jgi:hypothetical protein
MLWLLAEAHTLLLVSQGIQSLFTFTPHAAVGAVLRVRKCFLVATLCSSSCDIVFVNTSDDCTNASFSVLLLLPLLWCLHDCKCSYCVGNLRIPGYALPWEEEAANCKQGNIILHNTILQ